MRHRLRDHGGRRDRGSGTILTQRVDPTVFGTARRGRTLERRGRRRKRWRLTWGGGWEDARQAFRNLPGGRLADPPRCPRHRRAARPRSSARDRHRRHPAGVRARDQRDARRLHLRQRHLGRRHGRRWRPPPHLAPRRRVGPALLARRLAGRLHRPLRRQHRRVRGAGRGRRAEAAHLPPRQRRRPRLHARRQVGPLLLGPRGLHGPVHAALHGAGDRRFPREAEDPERQQGADLARREDDRLRAARPSPSTSGSATAAAPRRGSSSSTPRRTPSSRCRSRRGAATTPTRCGWAIGSSSAPTATASSTSTPSIGRRRPSRRLTSHADFPVVNASAGGGRIAYEQAGYVHLLDPASGASHAAEARRRQRPLRAAAALGQGRQVDPRRQASRRAARAWPSSSGARS